MSYTSGMEEMLRRAVADALATPEVRELLADEGLEPSDVQAVEVSHPSFGEAVVEI